MTGIHHSASGYGSTPSPTFQRAKARANVTSAASKSVATLWALVTCARQNPMRSERQRSSSATRSAMNTANSASSNATSILWAAARMLSWQRSSARGPAPITRKDLDQIATLLGVGHLQIGPQLPGLPPGRLRLLLLRLAGELAAERFGDRPAGGHDGLVDRLLLLAVEGHRRGGLRRRIEHDQAVGEEKGVDRLRRDLHRREEVLQVLAAQWPVAAHVAMDLPVTGEAVRRGQPLRRPAAPMAKVRQGTGQGRSFCGLVFHPGHLHEGKTALNGPKCAPARFRDTETPFVA